MSDQTEDALAFLPEQDAEQAAQSTAIRWSLDKVPCDVLTALEDHDVTIMAPLKRTRLDLTLFADWSKGPTKAQYAEALREIANIIDKA
jgi:hypothetical protein